MEKPYQNYFITIHLYQPSYWQVSPFCRSFSTVLLTLSALGFYRIGLVLPVLLLINFAALYWAICGYVSGCLSLIAILGNWDI